MTSISGCNLCRACPLNLSLERSRRCSSAWMFISCQATNILIPEWVSEWVRWRDVLVGVWEVSKSSEEENIEESQDSRQWTRHELSLLGKWDEEGVPAAPGLFLEKVIVLSSCRSPIIHDDLFELMNYNLLRQNVGQIEWWWWWWSSSSQRVQSCYSHIL